jgi:hypothetical protein
MYRFINLVAQKLSEIHNISESNFDCGWNKQLRSSSFDQDMVFVQQLRALGFDQDMVFVQQLRALGFDQDMVFVQQLRALGFTFVSQYLLPVWKQVLTVTEINNCDHQVLTKTRKGHARSSLFNGYVLWVYRLYHSIYFARNHLSRKHRWCPGRKDHQWSYVPRNIMMLGHLWHHGIHSVARQVVSKRCQAKTPNRIRWHSEWFSCRPTLTLTVTLTLIYLKFKTAADWAGPKSASDHHRTAAIISVTVSLILWTLIWINCPFRDPMIV